MTTTIKPDQRQEYRLARQEVVFIEVVAADPDTHRPAEILISHSVDISANGLQVTLDQPLPCHRILAIAIQLEEQPGPISLMAEVKWCQTQPGNDQRWQVGLAILESDDTGLGNWKHLLAAELLTLD